MQNWVCNSDKSDVSLRSDRFTPLGIITLYPAFRENGEFRIAIGISCTRRTITAHTKTRNISNILTRQIRYVDVHSFRYIIRFPISLESFGPTEGYGLTRVINKCQETILWCQFQGVYQTM